MYQLYSDKEKCILEIKPLKTIFKDVEVTDDVKQFNQYYYFCNKRKSLKEFAFELKLEWIKEAEERLFAVEKIVI